MDDPRILRIITVGLILAGIVVIYLLFTGGFAVKSKVNKQANNLIQDNTPSITPAPASSPKVAGSPTLSAFNRAASRAQTNTQSKAQTLPNTGFPVDSALVFCAFAIVSGITLSKIGK